MSTRARPHQVPTLPKGVVHSHPRARISLMAKMGRCGAIVCPPCDQAHFRTCKLLYESHKQSASWFG